MTVSRAWEKSVTDSEKDTVLYQELRTVLAISGEVNRRQALLRILPQVQNPEITKFVSALLQKS